MQNKKPKYTNSAYNNMLSNLTSDVYLVKSKAKDELFKNIDKDKWVEDSKGFVREVKEVKRLVDVSLVTRPAYPQTSAAVRSLDHHKEVTKDNVKTRKSKLKLLKLKK